MHAVHEGQLVDHRFARGEREDRHRRAQRSEHACRPPAPRVADDPGQVRFRAGQGDGGKRERADVGVRRVAGARREMRATLLLALARDPDGRLGGEDRDSGRSPSRPRA